MYTYVYIDVYVNMMMARPVKKQIYANIYMYGFFQHTYVSTSACNVRGSVYALVLLGVYDLLHSHDPLLTPKPR